jgi:hypothetical protein
MFMKSAHHSCVGFGGVAAAARHRLERLGIGETLAWL